MAKPLESPKETEIRIAAAAAEREVSCYQIGTPEHHDALLKLLTLHRKYLDLREERRGRAEQAVS